MRYQRFENRIQARLTSGEHVHQSLITLLVEQGIGYASITGLGAVRWVRLAYWNAETREYEPHEVDEQLEVVSLVGNVSLRDDAPFLHLHISLGRHDLTMFGGHFLDAVVHPNCEVWIQREAQPVHRRVEADSGLALMDLPDHG